MPWDDVLVRGKGKKKDSDNEGGKHAALLALLLSCLIALPPVALADDTELFTTSANPNVLLMLDTTGSMDTLAGSSSVGDLDGDNPSDSRMDVLWKVVYTLLNSDLSIPSSSTNYNCRTSQRIRTRNNPYRGIRVDGSNWSHFRLRTARSRSGAGARRRRSPTAASRSPGEGLFQLLPGLQLTEQLFQ